MLIYLILNRKFSVLNMSGSLERLPYDQGAYSKKLQESTAPLAYVLDPIGANQCSPCRPSNVGYLGKVGVSLTNQRPLIDVESDLLNINRYNSKDPNEYYKPICPRCGNCNEGYPCGGGVLGTCQNCQENLAHLPSCDISTEYTRISNPLCTAREVGVNRFQPLCLNPQDEQRWLHASEVGISYRNVVKDNHVPCIPRPLDQSAVFPNGGKIQTCPMVHICGVFNEPMHSHGQVNKYWNVRSI